MAGQTPNSNPGDQNAGNEVADGAEQAAKQGAEGVPEQSDALIDEISDETKAETKRLENQQSEKLQQIEKLREKAVEAAYHEHKAAMRKGLVDHHTFWEGKFLRIASEGFDENAEKFLKAAQEAEAKDQDFELLVDFANAKKYLDLERTSAKKPEFHEKPASDEEMMEKMKTLNPEEELEFDERQEDEIRTPLKFELFGVKRPREEKDTKKIGTTNLQKIIDANAEITLNQVITLSAYLQEEEIRKEWEKKNGKTKKFDNVSPEEYEQFKDEIAGNEKLMDLKKQLNEFMERYEKWQKDFKKRFKSMPELHPEISWETVETTLENNVSAVLKLMKLDQKSHEMNVFGEKDGEIVFRSAQRYIEEIAPEHRNIMYDRWAQTDYPQFRVNGNAVDIAASLGVQLADRDLYNQLTVYGSGWVWLETDAKTAREDSYAFFGNRKGVEMYVTNGYHGTGSFCAALRVKKA